LDIENGPFYQALPEIELRICQFDNIVG